MRLSAGDFGVGPGLVRGLALRTQLEFQLATQTIQCVEQEFVVAHDFLHPLGHGIVFRVKRAASEERDQLATPFGGQLTGLFQFRRLDRASDRCTERRDSLHALVDKLIHQPSPSVPGCCGAGARSPSGMAFHPARISPSRPTTS